MRENEVISIVTRVLGITETDLLSCYAIDRYLMKEPDIKKCAAWIIRDFNKDAKNGLIPFYPRS